MLTSPSLHSLESLPLENTYNRLPAPFFQRVQPTPLPAPYLVAFNPDAAALIDLDPAEALRPEFVAAFSGSARLRQSEPLAAIYAGHQFGHIVPQLGDGRAITLGDTVNARGERWEISLKGAGLTAFSRDGDGRAVLRSTIREYLCSEAMHGLGIATTRALCITGSDEPIYRETLETAAVLVRLAPTFVRIGTFELFYSRKQHDHLRALADYVIEHHYPQLAGEPEKYVKFLREVCARTAIMIAGWQSVGFTHGVMNTDNMSILGLTIDYGPFGFTDAYQPGFVCNHTDVTGRYALDQQPSVAFWNLRCLAQCMTALIAQEEAREALGAYEPDLRDEYRKLMQRKLGLDEWRESDGALLVDLLALLAQHRVDYTNFFRTLGELSMARELPHHMQNVLGEGVDLSAWFDRYRSRIAAQSTDDVTRRAAMNAANPKYILRNYLAQSAIEKAQQRDYSEIDRLWSILRAPFAEHPGLEQFAEAPPEWARGIDLSCSS